MPAHDIFSEWSAMSDVDRQIARAFVRPTAEGRATLKYRLGATLAKHFADIVPRFAKQFLLDRLMAAYRKAEARGRWSTAKVVWDVFFGKGGLLQSAKH